MEGAARAAPSGCANGTARMPIVATDAVDVILRDGRTLRLRPPLAADADALLEFFTALSPDSLLPPLPRLPAARRAAWWSRCSIPTGTSAARSWERSPTRTAVLSASWRSATMRACGAPALAEAAFAVADEHQGRGIGTRLLERLSERAAAVGIERFVAEVLPDNRHMLGVFESVGFELTRELAGGELEVQFPIAPTERYESRVAERDHLAVVSSLRPFFEPASVAVIGASRRRGSIGGELFRNVLEGDFAGAAYPVNRDGEPVAGVRGYRSIEEIPDPGRPRSDLAAGRGRARGRRVRAPPRRARARRHLRRLRGGGQRGRRAAGAAARPRSRPRRPADRPELPRHRRFGAEPERDIRRALRAARHDRLLLAERRARARVARGSRGARARALRVHLDRQQGGRVDERSARVVGGGPRRRASC